MNKITIIIPVYNVEKYLEKCLNSILEQTYKNIEIILINDGSTDKSKEICMRYKNKDKRIVFIDKKNEGVSSVRNLGIEKSTGDYLAFIDSDDYIEKDYIEKLLKKILEKSSDMVIAGINYVEEDTYKLRNRYIPKEVSLTEIIKYSYPCNKLFKRSLFNNIEFPIGKKYEDLHTIPKMINKCKSIVIEQNIFYNYLQREGGITKERDTNSIFDLIDGYISLEIYLRKTKDYNEFLKIKNSFKYTFISSYYSNQSFIFKIVNYKKVEKKLKELEEWNLKIAILQIAHIFIPRYYIRKIYRTLKSIYI